MIKQIVINKLKLILMLLLIFAVTYLLRVDFIVPLCLLLVAVYLKLLYKDLFTRNYNLLNLSLLFVIIFVTGYFIIRQGYSFLYIPFCAIPILATLLFQELKVSLLITLVSSLSLASVAGNNFSLGAFSLISGILSIILVYNVRRRVEIIRAGIIVGFAQLVLLFLMDKARIHAPDRYLIIITNGLVSSIIALGALPVFEYLFRVVTNISLLELTDFNHPLLQRLILEAPGTYHHSLVVGNLSEAACAAVGANSLLARVGAYYHDIGKIQKPEYFSENQEMSRSKHDDLSPTMSRLIIMNHVKEGVELANRYKLNPFLINFILQHHGTSLVYYFYRRALENQVEDQKVQEEGFRYPGPKPKTKETAIVLLADSVEAATRALREPTPANIEEVVHKVINNKFIDRQLDECELTLNDIEKISSVFIRILSGIYHGRIVYPERERSAENNHKKPAKENLRPTDKDKKNGS
jgi:putative nucleotidyltransferase with HDIG domain